MRCSKARGVEGIIPCAFLQISQYNTLRFFTDFDILYLALFYNSRAREAIKALVEDRTYVKCYMGDTGLLLSHAFSEKEITEGELYKKLLNDRLSINKGMLFENLVAQMLVANGHDLYFYTHYNSEKHRNDMEIDFMLSNGSKTNYKINPVEVKSSKNYTTTSLTSFRNKYKKRVETSYVIHPKNLRIDNEIMYMPVYMTFLL